MIVIHSFKSLMPSSDFSQFYLKFDIIQIRVYRNIDRYTVRYSAERLNNSLYKISSSHYLSVKIT
jgi:hypothetical protein